MQSRFLDALGQNRNQADTALNQYGDTCISGNGSTVLGNLYQTYYVQPPNLQAFEPVTAQVLNQYSHNVHWTIDRPKNPSFTGRLDIIHRISEVICDALVDPFRIEQCRIVITGMGGQGKSEICLQVAHSLRHLFWAVWWVDVSTLTSAQSCFQAITNQLHMSDSTIDDVRRALANLSYFWLLILDNADDTEFDYLRYFPTGNLGVILLTSRNSECQQYGSSDTIALDGLPSIDARELLLKAAQVPQTPRDAYERDAQLVASFLLGHPLATIQAGSYIQRGHCSLAEYPRVFQTNRKRLLKFRPSQAQSRYGDVYTTFEASADAIRSANSEAANDALQLLSVLATLSPHPFPLSLFEQAWKGAKKIPAFDDAGEYWPSADLQAISFLPKFIETTDERWDPYRLLEAVRLLEAYSLLVTNDFENTKCVSMHPLAHAWAKDRQDSMMQQQSWLTAACSIYISSLDYHDLPDLDVWVSHQQRLRAHLLDIVTTDYELLPWRETQALVVRIMHKCGSLLAKFGLKHQLFDSMQEVFSRLCINMKIVDPRWLPLYELVAREILMDREPQDAIALLEQVVSISEQQLPGADRFRVLWPWYLARAYVDHNQVPKAVTLLEKVRLGIDKGLIAKNSNYLLMMNELAEAYWKLGQTDKANLLLERTAIETCVQPLDLHDRDRLQSLCWLAETYGKFQQHQKAILTLKQVVALREESLTETHPDRLLAQHELALAHLAGGEPGKAASMLEEVVSVQERNLVKSHPDLLAAQQYLARAYRKSGQAQKAVDLSEKLVKVKQQLLFVSSKSSLFSQYELGRAYSTNGEAAKAVTILEGVVEVERGVLAEDDRHRMSALDALIHAYGECRLHQKAVRIAEEVVRIDERTTSEDDPWRLGSQHVLSTLYYRTNRMGEAIRLMRAVVKARRQALGEGDLQRKSSESWLVFLQKKILDQALRRTRGKNSADLRTRQHALKKSLFKARSCPASPANCSTPKLRQHVWLDDMVYVKPFTVAHYDRHVDAEQIWNKSYERQENEISYEIAPRTEIRSLATEYTKRHL